MPPTPHPAAKRPPHTAVGRPTRSGNFRFSAAHFLIALVLLFILTPVAELFPGGETVEGAMMTLVLVTGVLAVGRRRRTRVAGVALLVPALIIKWLSLYYHDPLLQEIYLVFALIFIAFVILELILFVLRAPRVNSEVLCAGVSGYLLLGLAWGFGYMLVALLNPMDATHPGAFAFSPAAPHILQGFEAYYFSFITLATVGYGDITPVSIGARSLAMTEVMTGTLYVAVLISRLVALYSSASQTASEGDQHDKNAADH